jgi:hypothetical protein
MAGGAIGLTECTSFGGPHHPDDSAQVLKGLPVGGVPPNKRMQPTHPASHQICIRKFAACLARG